MEKKLYRSNSNRMIAGVCSGLAEYLDFDASIIRILWALSVLLLGTGLLIYIVCAIIIPNKPY
ncbi:PspC domain-containing protein [Clostridium sp. YIM B02515]|uniref:PspC domain-containing protein n=1 Tax=Clostridium rhizosphaerae TaxID=2803861 RepID=A0ABS1T8F3_9CLOT|nr:PspC domain-containing protein [Clostridium rhizosphaerae]MBL4935612.1 PspC domain-containing protein [Clostridium rhizosphaerae]